MELPRPDITDETAVQTIEALKIISKNIQPYQSFQQYVQSQTNINVHGMQVDGLPITKKPFYKNLSRQFYRARKAKSNSHGETIVLSEGESNATDCREILARDDRQKNFDKATALLQTVARSMEDQCLIDVKEIFETLEVFKKAKRSSKNPERV